MSLFRTLWVLSLDQDFNRTSLKKDDDASAARKNWSAILMTTAVDFLFIVLPTILFLTVSVFLPHYSCTSWFQYLYDVLSPQLVQSACLLTKCVILFLVLQMFIVYTQNMDVLDICEKFVLVALLQFHILMHVIHNYIC